MFSSSSGPSLRLALFALVFSLFASPLLSQETPPGGPTPGDRPGADAPPPPADAPKDAILVYSQYFFREGRHHFKVEGHAPHPDGVTLGIALCLRRRPSEVVTTATVQDGQFAAELSSSLRLLPGYYEIRATFDPVLQFNMSARLVAGQPKREGGFFIRIGTDEEILEMRKKLLVYYKSQIAKFESAYNDRIRAVYVKIIKDKSFSRDRAKEVWDRETKSVIAQLEKDINAFRAEFADCVIPMFPQLHSYIDVGFLRLFAVTSDLELALISELVNQGKASGKNLTHEDILKLADEAMKDLFDMLNTQVLLEEEEHLRDLLLNQMKELQWLHTASAQEFGKIVESGAPPTDAMREAWKNDLATWTTNLDSLKEGLAAHEKSELAKKNSVMMASMKSVPGLLSDLWAMYSAVIVDGRSGLDRQIGELAMKIDVMLAKMIEVFDFGDELDELKRGGYVVTGRGSAASQEHALRLVGERITDLASDKADVRLKAVKILVAFKNEAEKQILAGFESGEPRVKDACALVMGLGGDGKAFDALVPRLESEKDAPTRAAIADALGVIGKREGLAPLGKALKKDADPAVRGAVAAAIGNLHLNDGVPILIDALKDGDASVRTRVFQSINSLVALSSEIQFTAEAPEDVRAVQIEHLRQWWAANK